MTSAALKDILLALTNLSLFSIRYFPRLTVSHFPFSSQVFLPLPPPKVFFGSELGRRAVGDTAMCADPLWLLVWDVMEWAT